MEKNIKHRYLILFFIIFMSILTACGGVETHSNTLQVYGVVIDSNEKATENINVVVFFDNVEIARSISSPLYSATLECGFSPPQSSIIGYNCYNLSFSLPRVAEFNQDGSNTTINLRNILIGETKSFRSIDGRFLVFQAFEKPPVRSLLLLQADDTVITPLPGTPVVTPTFSARPAPTQEAEQQTNQVTMSNNSMTNTGSFFDDWLRPFMISGGVGILIAVFMYWALSKKKEAIAVTQNKKADTKGDNQNAFFIAVSSGVISTVVGTIILRILGY